MSVDVFNFYVRAAWLLFGVVAMLLKKEAAFRFAVLMLAFMAGGPQ